MIVITDSNKIMSAIYAPKGVEASMFSAKSKIQFIAPDYVIDEFKEHLTEIAEAIGLSKRETQDLFLDVLINIKILEVAKLPRTHTAKAKQIAKDIDEEDMPFIALHLATKHKLWTGDIKLIKGLKKKGYKICITTAELKKSLYKK